MNLMTFSPALTLLYVCALLWILMDIHFRDLTKTQKWLVPLLILLLGVFNHVLRLEIGPIAHSKMIFLTMHLPYFLLFLHLTKCGIVKMVFMIFTAVVFMAPTTFVANYAKDFIANSPWRLFLINLIGFGIGFLMAQFIFRQGFNYIIKYADNRFILRFSVVPLLYYVYVFAGMNLDFSSLTSAGGYVVKAIPTVYVFVFYFLLLRNYKELNEKRELETAQATLRQQLTAAAEQITLLNKAQTETAIYQHNMRHHLTAIEGFLSTGNFQQAEDYIKEVQADVEAITPQRFCENELVNLLCSSFSNKAEHKGIQLTVKAKLPRDLSISDTELCSILSNGLENALRAVSELEPSLKWTELYCGIRTNKLLIEIKNPYAGEITMRNGLPISDWEGHGYGCRSIQSIAHQNRGFCSFGAENGLFTLRIVLPVSGETARDLKSVESNNFTTPVH